MDPLLIVGLGIGLVNAINEIAKIGVYEPALERGLEGLRNWVRRGYDEKQDAEELRRSIGKALDELKKRYPVDDPQRLLAVLKLTGLNQEQHTALAAAALEMGQLNPSTIPDDLMNSLGLEDTQREMLARFLFHLRRELFASLNYRDAITYANDLDQRGQLAGLSQKILDLNNQAASAMTLLQAMAKSRRLAINEPEMLKEYLAWACERWGSVPLPLIRKRSGDIVHTRLKQVYVPLLMRDLAAEEKAQKQLAKRKKPALAGEKIPAPASLGEVLARHSRFILIGTPGCGKTTLLLRAALAFAEGRADQDLNWGKKPLLPIFARLRTFGAFLSQHREEYPAPCPGALATFFENQYREAMHKDLTADFFDRRLEEGDCLVLLDGLDEVADNRSEVAQYIKEFIIYYGKKPGNCFGLSSRPRGYETVEYYLRPANLAAVEVRPLDEEGIRELTGNLFMLIEPDTEKRKQDAEGLVQSILDSEDLSDIASIPLFCSALVQVYKYHGAHLPERRVEVLDEIVDLLLGFWKAQEAVADTERLAADDGTGKFHTLEESVNVKRQRLSFLAYRMQENHLAAIEAAAAVELLSQYLMERERVKDADTACQWAEGFLLNSHERSGLLVEQETGIYAFLHKSFMEYLAATWLVSRNEVIPTVLAHLEDKDDWWETVLRLAGAHPKLSEGFKSDLICQLLERAGKDGNPDARAAALVMAGKQAVDMAEHLPGPEHEAVEQELLDAIQGMTFRAKERARMGRLLGRLGDPRPEVTTLEAMQFCFIPSGPFYMGQGKDAYEENAPDFWLGRYPVTNAQFNCFVEANGYAEERYWDEAQRAQCWKEGQFMGRWDDVGRTRPMQYGVPFNIANHPVVGVSWYEAWAFTLWLDEMVHERGWLLENWRVTLPDERHWEKAARGGLHIPENEKQIYALKEIPAELPKLKLVDNPLPGRVYPWGDEFDTEKANVNETGIGGASAVGCFLQGASPYGVLEMSGNVWEWQENWFDEYQDNKVLRGGSWFSDKLNAHCSLRPRYYPGDRLNYFGFRLSICKAP